MDWLWSAVKRGNETWLYIGAIRGSGVINNIDGVCVVQAAQFLCMWVRVSMGLA